MFSMAVAFFLIWMCWKALFSAVMVPALALFALAWRYCFGIGVVTGQVIEGLLALALALAQLGASLSGSLAPRFHLSLPGRTRPSHRGSLASLIVFSIRFLTST